MNDGSRRGRVVSIDQGRPGLVLFWELSPCGPSQHHVLAGPTPSTVWLVWAGLVPIPQEASPNELLRGGLPDHPEIGGRQPPGPLIGRCGARLHKWSMARASVNRRPDPTRLPLPRRRSTSNSSSIPTIRMHALLLNDSLVKPVGPPGHFPRSATISTISAMCREPCRFPPKMDQ